MVNFRIKNIGGQKKKEKRTNPPRLSEQSDHVYYLVATFNRGLRTRKVKKKKKKHSVGQGFSTLALLRVTKFFVVRVCSVRGRTFSISGYYPVDASGSPTLIPQL